MAMQVPAFKLPACSGVIDSLVAAQHELEMFRRELPHGTSRLRFDRLSNRLTKILRGARKFTTP